jgi:hypothetical protein
MFHFFVDGGCQYYHISHEHKSKHVHGITYSIKTLYYKKTKVNNLKVFGYLVYIFTPKDQINKLKNHTRKCMFTHYDAQSKA